MVYGLFIFATLLFFFIGYVEYENNDFACGTLFFLAGLLPLYSMVCDFVSGFCSYEVFGILKDCISALFLVAAIALIVKAYKDSSRHE